MDKYPDNTCPPSHGGSIAGIGKGPMLLGKPVVQAIQNGHVPSGLVVNKES